MNQIKFIFENLDTFTFPSKYVDIKVFDPANVGTNNLPDVSGVKIDIAVYEIGLDMKDLKRFFLNDITSIEYEGNSIYVPWGDDFYENPFQKTELFVDKLTIEIKKR